MTDFDTDVPPDATPHVCEHCGRPFARERYLALHRGLDHAAALSDDERAAYETAHDAETDDLRRFRLLALAGVVALYFGFLLTYAVVT
ncbi:C2H2-type zinc finger protein [Haloplanus rubicundus]|uniref:C2H2-type zinc finger protein n=1 Tax=Haloplanus rubicundus TaxID=1547898 RepID=A0A345E221_9EURY|nr:C2H2-type zinc finger protein [Haloplanus rubicundus]AXG06243.1 C2H2-type zinc finger protein [Haloplanus rubicundus]AXG09622.1 C2H2-type zinc finger protein [Haloplanus rubicundus]